MCRSYCRTCTRASGPVSLYSFFRKGSGEASAMAIRDPDSGIRREELLALRGQRARATLDILRFDAMPRQ